MPVGVEFRPAGGPGKARHVQAWAVIVEEEDVGLESAEAAVADFSGEPCEIVEGLDRGLGDVPGRGSEPVGAAVRPVELEPVSHRSAEQVADRNPERLALDVEERVLHGRDRLLDHAARRLAGGGVELRADAGDGERVFAHHPIGHEPFDDAAESRAAVTLVVLADAGDPFVRRHLEKGKVAPPRVAVEHLAAGNLHRVLLVCTVACRIARLMHRGPMTTISRKTIGADCGRALCPSTSPPASSDLWVFRRTCSD